MADENKYWLIKGTKIPVAKVIYFDEAHIAVVADLKTVAGESMAIKILVPDDGIIDISKDPDKDIDDAVVIKLKPNTRLIRETIIVFELGDLEDDRDKPADVYGESVEVPVGVRAIPAS